MSGPLIHIQGRFTGQQNLPHGQQKWFFPVSKCLIQFDKYPIHTSIVEKTWSTIKIQRENIEFIRKNPVFSWRASMFRYLISVALIFCYCRLNTDTDSCLHTVTVSSTNLLNYLGTNLLLKCKKIEFN
jgi:hypothetical protein